MNQWLGTRAKPIYLIAETCEITEMPKLLDVNIIELKTFGHICLFKQMTKFCNQVFPFFNYMFFCFLFLIYIDIV